jgi:hypothetical protein
MSRLLNAFGIAVTVATMLGLVYAAATFPGLDYTASTGQITVCQGPQDHGGVRVAQATPSVCDTCKRLNTEEWDDYMAWLAAGCFLCPGDSSDGKRAVMARR